MTRGQGNGHDRKIAVAETVRRLSRLRPARRLEAMVEAPNSRELVRATPAQELYEAIADVGLADATDIVQLASPEQFRTFVDLGAWKRDRLDPHQLLTWLRAARGDGGDRFRAQAAKLDVEVFQFMLRSFVTIHDREENPDVHPEGVTMETPEGRYLLELHLEGPELAALRAILGELFADDAFGAVRLLEASRWEIPSELEETAFRFRSARLEDLGFPPLEKAVSLFAWRDPDSVRWSRPPAAAGASLAVPDGVSFLEVAAHDLTPDEQAAFQRELRALSNEALVAEVQDPGDLPAVQRVAELVRDHLSMALEHLTGGAPALSAACVREIPARTLFQVGFSLTLRLKFQVDRLVKEPLAKLDGTWLALPQEARALEALARKRPLRALRVEGAEPVPFRNLRELEAARTSIGRAAAQIAFFRAALGGKEPAAREAIAGFGEALSTLGTERLLAALVAHALLDGVVRAAPVSSARLPELGGRLSQGGAAVERAASVLKGAAPPEVAEEVQALVESALERLRTELGPEGLSEGRLHPAVGEILPIAKANRTESH